MKVFCYIYIWFYVYFLKAFICKYFINSLQLLLFLMVSKIFLSGVIFLYLLVFYLYVFLLFFLIQDWKSIFCEQNKWVPPQGLSQAGLIPLIYLPPSQTQPCLLLLYTIQLITTSWVLLTNSLPLECLWFSVPTNWALCLSRVPGLSLCLFRFLIHFSCNCIIE